jgi:ATP-binding cassette, subfamily B, bacterial
VKTLKNLWRIAENYRIYYLIALVSLIISSVFTFTVPLVGKITIDAIIAGETVGTWKPVLSLIDWLGGRSLIARNLWIAGIFLIILTGFRALFLYFRDFFSALASESIIRRLRNRLFDHLQHLPVAYHSGAETGDLIQRCTSDVETLRLLFSKQTVELGRAAVFLAVAVPMMVMLDTKLAAVGIIFLPIVIAFSVVFFNRVRSVFQSVDEAEGELTTVLQENLTGVRVVRAFSRQEFECDKFVVRNAEYRDRTYRLFTLLAKFWATTDIMCFAQIGIVLLTGGWMVTKNMLTVGTLYAFLRIVGFLTFTIRELGRTLSETGKATVALGRIIEILDAPLEAEVGGTRADIQNGALKGGDEKTTGAHPLKGGIKGDINFNSVFFRYHPGDWVLKNLSFHIRQGETVAILGASGSGKSTLMRLLLRLYDFEEGEITVDGVNLVDIPRKQIRSQIGTSLQEPFLFAKTLRKNIKLSRPTSNDKQMVRAAETAYVHGTIKTFQSGYDTVIGERGVNLSGGQKQRVTLSRSFLKGPPIMILDDSLSAVDTDTEQKILRAMAERHGESTTIVITHRLSCCMVADHILVLEKGELVQEGNHNQLVAMTGFYQRLWNIQSELDLELQETQSHD